MIRYCLSLILSSTFPLIAFASQEVIEQNTPAVEYEQDASLETDETLATDPYEPEETATSEEYGSDKPVYSTETDEVVKLRAKVAAMEKEMQAMKGAKAPQAQANIQAAPGQIAGGAGQQNLDPDVAAVLGEFGIDATNLQESMGARNSEEAVAMAGAIKSAGTLEVGGVQAEFNKLQGDFKAANVSTDKAVLNNFKARCVTFIEKHQAHSLSRSALYYLARILMKNNEFKEAQSSFARVYKGDEQGPHAADALLGMATTFLKQNQKPAAIKFIEKVKKDYKPDYLTEETKAELSALCKAVGLSTAVKKPQTPAKKDALQKQAPAKPAKKTPASAA